MKSENLIQQQLSELVQQDLIDIFTEYSKIKVLKLELIVRLVQDINLFKSYNVTYIHNLEFDEIIDLFREELKNFNMARSIALLTCFDFLQNINQDFKKLIYINLSLKVPSEMFLEAFSFFNVLVSTVKELFNEFIIHIFNNKFLTLDENIQIETIYKIWNFSLQLYHDNQALKFAYDGLKSLFDKALLFEKTEVVFWLYYTPLHYFHSGTSSNIDELNKKFKNEIEKPLEKFILDKVIPKYQIQPNIKEINKNKRIKVAFVMQRIINHSTINVFYRLLESIAKNNNKKYEFLIYDLSFPESGGTDLDFLEKFKSLEFTYKNLHTEIFGNLNPIYSLLQKSMRTREILIRDNIDIMIGLHTRVEYIFLYATRTAPKQIYWYHGSNAYYDIKGIDSLLNHCTVIESSTICKNFKLPINFEEYNPKINKNILENTLTQFPKNSFILGYIGRLVKIEDNEYLSIIASLLKQNPNCIFIACGGGYQVLIKEKLLELGVLERCYFTGSVNPHVYGNIINLFLVSFLHPGGESLQEYMYKERPFVFKSPSEYVKNKILFRNKNIDILEKIKEKDEDYVYADLYTQRDLITLKNNDYLYEENKNAKTYSTLQFTCSIEEYKNIANLFIQDYEIAQKAAKENMLKSMKQNKLIGFYEGLE